MSVDAVSTFLAVGALLVTALVAVTWALALVARLGGPTGPIESIRLTIAGQGVRLAWVMALIATLGSLYFSEVAHFIPCELCWYQRIAMYPLALILGIAAWRGDRAIRRYVIPVAAVGGVISVYHYLIQHFPDLAAGGTCDIGIPCSAAWVWKFGFVSIPFMAMASFAAIITLLALDRGRDATREDART